MLKMITKIVICIGLVYISFQFYTIYNYNKWLSFIIEERIYEHSNLLIIHSFFSLLFWFLSYLQILKIKYQYHKIIGIVCLFIWFFICLPTAIMLVFTTKNSLILYSKFLYYVTTITFLESAYEISKFLYSGFISINSHKSIKKHKNNMKIGIIISHYTILPRISYFILKLLTTIENPIKMYALCAIVTLTLPVLYSYKMQKKIPYFRLLIYIIILNIKLNL